VWDAHGVGSLHGGGAPVVHRWTPRRPARPCSGAGRGAHAPARPRRSFAHTPHSAGVRCSGRNRALAARQCRAGQSGCDQTKEAK
jgi:hypothetical protein